MVVFGCGPIGMSTMLTCKAVGATVLVVEHHPYRRKLAEDLGADMAIDPSTGNAEKQIMKHTDDRGASLVIECSGSDGGRAATLDVVANRGRIVLIGLHEKRKVPIEIDKVIFKGATIKGSSGSSYFLDKTLAFLSRKQMDFSSVITHRFPLEEVHKALEVTERQGESSKVMIV